MSKLTEAHAVGKKHQRALHTSLRSDWMYFVGQANEKGEAKLDWSGVKGGVLVNGRPALNVRMVRSYERNHGKPKVLASIPANGRVPKLNVMQEILEQFDYLHAVDTNTVEVNGKWVSVTAAFSIEQNLKMYLSRTEAPASLEALFLEVHKEKPIDPEGRGWYYFLTHGLNGGVARNPNNKIALVVDSKLGLHDEINERREPYFQRFGLPDGYQLVYASDAANDSPLNSLIRTCDKVASQVLKQFCQGKYGPPNSQESNYILQLPTRRK